MCVCVLRRVLGHSVREGGQVLNILIVQPLDLEVQVHVVSSLTELVLLVFCKDDIHTHTQNTHKHTEINTCTTTVYPLRCVAAVAGLHSLGEDF